ncbi:uncharacterized protein TRUGW13939_01940 [Talaromyces rugulosus]|uniref:AAA+ ATPase domain-containing protein n=1 Tax=Talaromyces rugulosus TaxID=121627 RepID=A0A7H8QMT3_TALRU|nr:uncharacterized protein TRUGW13939_01940 [Talaromyces rugulosus]QKX54851.1 hypothetical protein TRUGW13939_01940 [Talaromyces rugulosus]
MASGGGRRWQQFLQELVMIAGTSASAYFLIRYLLSRIDLDPDSQKKEEQKRKSAAILRRLDVPDADDGTPGSQPRHKQKKEDLVLNQYEQSIAMDVVAPEDIPVSFEDIGGLDDIIEELKESVIYPLTMPHLYTSTSSLLSAPSGVLLYGPPGCGKTMLAKALAHESGACFINLHISTLTEKWYGDSNKLVNAVFSLARKLQPSIVFIDEIDAVLGTRRSGEHEASGYRDQFDLEYLVSAMAGMSGSDIKEACRDAAMVPMRELIRQKKAAGVHMTTVQPWEVRGLRTEDFYNRAGSGLKVIPKPAASTNTTQKDDKEWSTDSEGGGEGAEASIPHVVSDPPE